MATAKQSAHAMVTYFVDRYKEKYAVQPVLNRHKARWGFEDIMLDMGMDELKQLIDYYFGTVSRNGHSLDWFLYNYEKLVVAMEDTKADAAALAAIREQTKRRTEEWRAKNGIN